MKENKIISMAHVKVGKREICCGERGIQGYSVDSTVLYVMYLPKPAKHSNMLQ
jgi:hypothetical protein